MPHSYRISNKFSRCGYCKKKQAFKADNQQLPWFLSLLNLCYLEHGLWPIALMSFGSFFTMQHLKATADLLSHNGMGVQWDLRWLTGTVQFENSYVSPLGWSTFYGNAGASAVESRNVGSHPSSTTNSSLDADRWRSSLGSQSFAFHKCELEIRALPTSLVVVSTNVR